MPSHILSSWQWRLTARLHDALQLGAHVSLVNGHEEGAAHYADVASDLALNTAH
jgi:hypothetical protein